MTEEMNEMKYKQPMSAQEIALRTGPTGRRMMEFIQEEYPKQFLALLKSGELYSLVINRVEEYTETYVTLFNQNERRTRPEGQEDFMEKVQRLQQARQIALEVVDEEILYRPLVTENE